ncbi:TRAP transporter large permease subunit [Acidisphaera sp. L21]|uniref:TRAP transporter large permease n=1 Tax=Acidisphaera sp. L21 TaxID=1641851 RepID=UPI0020B11D41|nr:TRAP transporter large permease subunit [Acidisphaera sp. L21]
MPSLQTLAPPTRSTGLLQTIETGLRLAAEIPAAILMLAEIGILFTGVVYRYVLNDPLVWSDELAGTLFLWLVMLGAAVAVARGEHMRLVLGRKTLSPRWRQRLDGFATVMVALFAAEIIVPAWRHQLDQVVIESPALGIPDDWRVAAMTVGTALILAMSVCRLVRNGRLWDVAGSLAVAACVAGALYVLRPWLVDIGNLNLIIFFVLLVGGCVLAGVPIAFAFGTGSFAYLALTTRIPLTIVVSRMDEGMSNLVLLSVPMFVFLGLLMEATGLARVLVDFLAALCGHVRGGLSFVLLGAMFLVSGISGAKAADMAAVAPVLFPEMRRRGANEGELVALLATSAAMSETIPPSLVLIMIGSVTGVSISALFTGGLLPALVVAACLMVLARWRARTEDLSQVRRAPARVVLRGFIAAIPALVLPFLIRAAVVDGIATATEVSTFGIIYCVAISLLVYRQFPLRRLYPMLVETASLSGAILLIIGAATSMAWALTRSGFSQKLVDLAVNAPGGQLGFWVASILLFGVLGSVLEGIPVIVLFGPLLFPAARALHIHEVHYAMVAILAMGAGLFAPPFGVGFYAACAISKVSPDAAVLRIWPYIGALLVGLVIVVAVPWLSIGLL